MFLNCLLIALLAEIYVTSGLTMKASRNYFVNNEPFALTCSNIETNSNVGYIVFMKDKTIMFYIGYNTCKGYDLVGVQVCNGTFCNCSTDRLSYSWIYIGTINSTTVDFTCEIYYSFERSNVLSLKVGHIPRFISLSTSVKRVVVNENSTLNSTTCTADCVPSCRYNWNGPGIKGNETVLQTNNIHRSWNGTYECVAENELGKSSVTLDVIVHFGPENITLNTSVVGINIEENEDLGPISCTAECYPTCEYQWNGPGFNLSSTSSELYLSRIRYNQSGIYTCISSNVVGTLNIQILVTVYRNSRSSYVSAAIISASVVGSIVLMSASVCLIVWRFRHLKILSKESKDCNCIEISTIKCAVGEDYEDVNQTNDTISKDVKGQKKHGTGTNAYIEFKSNVSCVESSYECVVDTKESPNKTEKQVKKRKENDYTKFDTENYPDDETYEPMNVMNISRPSVVKIPGKKKLQQNRTESFKVHDDGKLTNKIENKNPNVHNNKPLGLQKKDTEAIYDNLKI